MKNAYEIAMERLKAESGAAKTLTDEQRARIADIEKKYDARIAETRLSFEEKMAGATNYEELNALRAELAQTLQGLEEKRDREKDAVWNE